MSLGCTLLPICGDAHLRLLLGTMGYGCTLLPICGDAHLAGGASIPRAGCTLLPICGDAHPCLGVEGVVGGCTLLPICGDAHRNPPKCKFILWVHTPSDLRGCTSGMPQLRKRTGIFAGTLAPKQPRYASPGLHLPGFTALRPPFPAAPAAECSGPRSHPGPV